MMDAGTLFPISAVDDEHKGPASAPPKNRGRPAGAKNRPKQTVTAEASSSAAKKKRGRPVGSRNK